MADLFDVYGIKDAPKVVGAAMAPIPTSKPDERPWSDVALSALQNAPASAVEFGKSLIQPILHPVDTAKAVGDLAAGVASKLTPAPSWWKGPGEDTADAVGQFYKDRYGGMENIKNTIASDPVGFLADASVPLTAAGTLPVRGAQVVGRVGAAIDPVTATLRTAGATARMGGNALANTLGFNTGAGTEAVHQAVTAGQQGNRVFLDHMRGNADMTDVADMAREGVAAMRRERSADYGTGMAPIREDRTVLDFQPVDQAFATHQAVGTHEGVPLRRSTAEVQTQIGNLLDEWRAYPPDRFHTAAGLDALKQAIGDIRDSSPIGTPARTFADRVYRSVADEVAGQAPDYRRVMDAYRTASEQIDELERTFSLGQNATDDTALRKLQSVMRNNAQTNYGNRTELANELAQRAPDLPAALAGQSFNTPMPRGLVGRLLGGGAGIGAATLLDPTLMAAALTTSPRLVGEGAYLTGRVGAGAEDLAQALRLNRQNVRVGGQGAFQSGRAEDVNENAMLGRLLMQINERRRQ